MEYCITFFPLITSRFSFENIFYAVLELFEAAVQFTWALIQNMCITRYNRKYSNINFRTAPAHIHTLRA